MSAKRNLAEVVAQMLAVIPESEEQLRAELERCRQSAVFTAPEIMSGVWRRAAEALNEHLGPRDPNEWTSKVAEIFNGPSQ